MLRLQPVCRRLVLNLLLVIWGHLTPGALSTWLLRSSDLGVSSCTFHGSFQNATMVLYTYITACRSPINPNRLHISGIFFMYNPLAPRIEAQIMPTEESRKWAFTPDNLVLRSPRTGKQWSLRLFHIYKGPGRIFANITLDDPLDQHSPEFNLLARPRFQSFCSFDAGAARSPPWPHLPATQPDPGPNTCAWLQPGSTGQDGATAAPIQPSTSYMILSPFFGLSISQYATLLMHHMRYHEQFGINRYLVYVEGRISALSAEPRLQALIRAGRLRIVVLDGLPHFYREPKSKSPLRQPYAWQTLTYNHARLALWHENATAAIADLDEYLFSSKRSLAQILTECSGLDSDVVSSVHVVRRDGHYTGCCTVSAADGATNGAGSGPKLDFKILRAAHDLERSLWLENKTSAAAADGDYSAIAPHPIALYGISTRDVPKTDIKSVLRPHKVGFSDPHRSWPLLGYRYVNVTADCAFWLHLRSQIALRFPVFGNFTDPQEISRPFLWPLRELARQAQGAA